MIIFKHNFVGFIGFFFSVFLCSFDGWNDIRDARISQISESNFSEENGIRFKIPSNKQNLPQKKDELNFLPENKIDMQTTFIHNDSNIFSSSSSKKNLNQLYIQEVSSTGFNNKILMGENGELLKNLANEESTHTNVHQQTGYNFINPSYSEPTLFNNPNRYITLNDGRLAKSSSLPAINISFSQESDAKKIQTEDKDVKKQSTNDATLVAKKINKDHEDDNKHTGPLLGLFNTNNNFTSKHNETLVSDYFAIKNMLLQFVTENKKEYEYLIHNFITESDIEAYKAKYAKNGKTLITNTSIKTQLHFLKIIALNLKESYTNDILNTEKQDFMAKYTALFIYLLGLHFKDFSQFIIKDNEFLNAIFGVIFFKHFTLVSENFIKKDDASPPITISKINDTFETLNNGIKENLKEISERLLSEIDNEEYYNKMIECIEKVIKKEKSDNDVKKKEVGNDNKKKEFDIDILLYIIDFISPLKKDDSLFTSICKCFRNIFHF